MTLQAGDNFTDAATSTISSVADITIVGDFGNTDAAGSTINILGTLNAMSTNILGDSDNDTVNLAPDAAATISGSLTVAGGSGTDTVNFNTAVDLLGAGADLMVTAEEINFNATTITTTDDDQTFAGAVFLGPVDVQVTGDDIDFLGTIDLDDNTLTTDTTSADSLADGIISGTGDLVKDNIGTLTLTAANTYSGTTTINGGTLDLTGSLLNAGDVVTLAGSGTTLTSSNGLGVIGNRTVAITGDGATISFLDRITASGGIAVNVSAAGATLLDNDIRDSAVGVNIIGAGASATLTGNTVTDNTTGVNVGSDGTVFLDTGNTITGGTDGLVVTGPTSPGHGIGGLTLSDTVFDGQTDFYVELVSLAHSGPEFINGESAGFRVPSDGMLLTGTGMTAEQIQSVDDKLQHYPDDISLGIILLRTGLAYKEEDTLLILGTFGNDRLISVNSTRPYATTVTGIAEVFGSNPDGTTFDMSGPTDRVVVFALDGRDVVRLTGFLPGDVYGGAGNDYLYGGSGTDVLRGQAGVDYIRGGMGDDMLIGGTGRDYLYGDTGNDISIGGGFGSTLSRAYSDLIGDIQNWSASAGVGTTILDDLFSALLDDDETDLLSDSSGTDAFIYQRLGSVGRDRAIGSSIGDDTSTWTYLS